MSDQILAATMRTLRVPAPVEKIIETDMLLTVMNHLDLAGKRVVLLACGHKTITRNSKRASCSDCHRMILAGEDYEAFRNRAE